MRKLIFLFVTALLAIPALAVAGTPPSPADKAAAVKQCSTERNAMGVPAFKALYGTNANKTNAFGKCVSKLAQQNEQNRSNAAAQCRTERTADATAFATKYGIGPNHRNAFGKCVSTKAKAAAAAQPRHRAFDYPAIAAQPAGGLDAAAGDARNNAACAQPASQVGEVAALVAVQFGRASPARSTSRWIFDPRLPRSTGFGPLSSPLCTPGR